MKIAVAMSGGVDSSVTAALLKRKGHEVFGITMQVVPEEEGESPAPVLAAGVVRALGIPHFTVDFRAFFAESIIADFCRQYSLGRTPNPCVWCNRLVKFGMLLEKAKKLGAEKLATGHYARIERRETDGRFLLKKGIDRRRDQSYFLYRLTQAQLGQVLFPLGVLTKDRVRRMAADISLPIAQNSESREVCFIPDNDYPRFLHARAGTGAVPGPIRDSAGRVLGEHRGIINYTIGQRHGLRVAAAQPLYVVAIDPETNTVVVGSKEAVYGREFTVAGVNWVACGTVRAPLDLKVKIRYQHPEAGAVVAPLGDSEVIVKFLEPQMAITPGQAAVFYDGEVVVGGGTIARVVN